MRVGTKSVLFGVHAFWLHPWFVAWAWWKLYGFPRDPRLWVAFFVHDLGYWGMPNMDGPEGEWHPAFGARFTTRLFDGEPGYEPVQAGGEWFEQPVVAWNPATGEDFLVGPWGQLVYCHSRFLASANNLDPSRLCYADKLAIVLTPWWLYMPLARLSGELDEYMAEELHDGGKYEEEGHVIDQGPRKWLESVKDYLRGWLREHCPQYRHRIRWWNRLADRLYRTLAEPLIDPAIPVWTAEAEEDQERNPHSDPAER